MSRPARGGWIEIHLNGALTDIAGPVGAAIPWDNKIENEYNNTNNEKANKHGCAWMIY